MRLYTRYDDAGGVTDKMIACVNDVERLGPEHLSRVKELLFEHCTMCFEATSYGHVFAEEGEDETEATRRTFGIRTPDDAYAQAHFEYVAVDGENDRLKHRYAVLIFYPTWEGRARVRHRGPGRGPRRVAVGRGVPRSDTKPTRTEAGVAVRPEHGASRGYPPGRVPTES